MQYTNCIAFHRKHAENDVIGCAGIYLHIFKPDCSDF